ncbi:MAG TPA: hypothetical protein VLA19_00445 [Herpetosiphonaceae bacterium]|nr:hypothetical protein [Herpetosiphonaceae bacterium]
MMTLAPLVRKRCDVRDSIITVLRDPAAGGIGILLAIIAIIVTLILSRRNSPKETKYATIFFVLALILVASVYALVIPDVAKSLPQQASATGTAQAALNIAATSTETVPTTDTPTSTQTTLPSVESTSTGTLSLAEAPIAPTSVTPNPTPTTSPEDVSPTTDSRTVFALQEANDGSFYSFGNAKYYFGEDGRLRISGYFVDGVYLPNPMPDNFRASFRLVPDDSPDQSFLVGLSKGTKENNTYRRPTYHFYVTPNLAEFKKHPDAEHNWDIPLQSELNPAYHIKQNTAMDVVLERRDGSIRVFIDSNLAILIHSSDPRLPDINEYDHLYIGGGSNNADGIIINPMTIENMEIVRLD